jgi:hypothetical protein
MAIMAALWPEKAKGLMPTEDIGNFLCYNRATGMAGSCFSLKAGLLKCPIPLELL